MDNLNNYSKKYGIAEVCFNIVNLIDKQQDYRTAHDKKIQEFNENPLQQNINNLDWIKHRLEVLKEDKKLSEEYLEVGFDVTKKIYDLRYMIDEIMLEDAKAKLTGNPPILTQSFIMFMNMSYDMINNFGKSKHGPKTVEELRTMVRGLYNYVLENDEDLAIAPDK